MIKNLFWLILIGNVAYSVRPEKNFPEIPYSSLLPQSCVILYDKQRICSSTLVAPDKILTAAHCLGGMDTGRLTVKCHGERKLFGIDDTYIPSTFVDRWKIAVTRANPHLTLNSIRGDDLAILQLSARSQLTPIRIPKTRTELESYFVDKKWCQVYGYGSGYHVGIFARLADLTPLSPNRAVDHDLIGILPFKEMKNYNTDSYPVQQGDSGAGLICPDENNYGVIIGALRSGTDFTSLYKYLNWVLSKL